MPSERFLRKLREQLLFLKRSCEFYDAGAEEEAIRIATILRILFHHTTSSTSLIRHLKLENSKMLSSDCGHGDLKGYLGIRISLGSPEPVRSTPKLGTRFCEIPVHQWWDGQRVFQHEGKTYQRREIVRCAANKDGGAHVDEKLEPFYEHLANGASQMMLVGHFEYRGPPPFQQGVAQFARNTHLALLRQFGHEVLHTAQHFNWLREHLSNPPPQHP